MNLSVGQKLLFIAMHTDKPRYIIDSMKLQYAIPGAILMDLVFLDILLLEDKLLKVVDSPNSIKEPYKDVIEIINSVKKKKKVKKVISKLSKHSKKYRYTFLENLEKKKLIRVENKKFLFIKYKLAYVENKSFRQSIIDDLKYAIENKKELSKNDISLISLIGSTKSEKIFTKSFKERREIRKKIKDYIEDEEIGKIVGDLVREMQAAIAASTVAATTAAVSASN